MTETCLLPHGRRVAATAVLLLLATQGCTRKAGDSQHDHHHDEEPKTAQITVWSNRHEIFAEHPLVVAGHPTRFVTHVTDLQSLEPRRNGAIRFVLQPANSASPPVEHLEKGPARDGIYEPVLQFSQPGEWSLMLKIPTDQGEDTIALPVLKVYATQHDAEHGESPPAPEGISFLKEQQWKIALKTEPAVRHRLTDSIRVPATANARPGLQAQVTPPLPGRLAPPSGRDFVIVGDRVTAGQTLAMVQPSYSDLALRLADAEAELTRARLELEQAQSTLQRVQKLAEVEAKSTRELQQAQFAVKSAQARLEAARTVQAALPVTRDTNTIAAGAPPSIPLIAPISGVVVEQSGTAVGQWVPADQPLFTLMDASRLFIQGHVPESAMNRLGNAQRASVELPDGTDSLSPLESTNIGRLVFLSPQVDPKTRTVAIVYEMDNREGRLRVGQQLFLHVETGRAEDALAIPTSALVEEGGIFVAFVQVSGETFQKRELRLGLKDARFVQVLDGIKEGERVVTKGAYAVRLASASSVIPAHGHTH